jgi:hypothetical protein
MTSNLQNTFSLISVLPILRYRKKSMKTDQKDMLFLNYFK